MAAGTNRALSWAETQVVERQQEVFGRELAQPPAGRHEQVRPAAGA